MPIQRFHLLVVFLCLGLNVAASQAWGHPTFEWIDQQWRVGVLGSETTGRSSIHYAFGVSATDGQITDLTSDTALFRVFADSASPSLGFSASNMGLFGTRKFRVMNSQNGWRMTIKSVLRGVLNTHKSLLRDLHPTAVLKVDAQIRSSGTSRFQMRLGFDEERTNGDDEDWTFDPKSVQQSGLLTDGEYEIDVTVTAASSTEESRIFSANAAADFFSTIDRDVLGRPLAHPIQRGVEISLSATPSPADIVNGSFETGPAPGDFTTLGSGSQAIQYWTVSKGTVDYVGTRWKAAEGNRSVDLNGSEPGAITQTFVTQPGTTYLVQFALAGNPEGGHATKELQVTRGCCESAQFLFNTTGRSNQNMGFTKQNFVFTATSSTTDLTFTSLTDGGYGPVIDDIVLLENVNPWVGLVAEEQSYKTEDHSALGFSPGCGGRFNLGQGFVGKFNFTATLAAKSGSPTLSNLVVRVAELSNGNLLQNADNGAGGLGALLTIPTGLDTEYRDGMLSYPENIRSIPFRICLKSLTRFEFKVDVFGTHH